MNINNSNSSSGRSFQGNDNKVETFGGKTSGSKDGVDYAGAAAGAVITDSQGNQKVVGRGIGGVSDGNSAAVGRGSIAGASNTDGSGGLARSQNRLSTDGNSVTLSKGISGAAIDSNGNARGGRAGGFYSTDGTNSAAGAGIIKGNSNADGSGSIVARGARGVTDGTNSMVQRGAAAGSRDRFGNTQKAAIGGSLATDGINTAQRVGGARYLKDPAGNVYARAGYATRYNGFVTGAGQVFAVQRGFNGYRTYYRAGWYARYPGAWYATGIAASAWWWAPSYGYVYGYTGWYATEPISYNYGTDGIYINNGDVYIGDKNVATQEEYYDQATKIASDFVEEKDKQAEEDADPETVEWLPLGVFAVVDTNQTKSDMTLQLAINKEGMIRGNLKVDLTDQVLQVKGSVDKQTQRAAFTFEGKKDIVVEAGLYNLTEDVLTVLVHHGKDRQEQRGLVRLVPPEEESEENEQGSQEPKAASGAPTGK